MAIDRCLLGRDFFAGASATLRRRVDGRAGTFLITGVLESLGITSSYTEGAN